MDSAVSSEHWAKACQLPAWSPAQPHDPYDSVMVPSLAHAYLWCLRLYCHTCKLSWKASITGVDAKPVVPWLYALRKGPVR